MEKYNLVEKVYGLWEQACEYDKQDPKSKFVVFSKDNPHVEDYNMYMEKLLKFQSKIDEIAREQGDEG